MELYRRVRELCALAEKTLPRPVLAIWAVMYCLLGLYAWMVFVLFLGAGVGKGYAHTIDELGMFFFVDLGIPYSRWLDGVLTWVTMILVMYYLARLIVYVREQKTQRRFRERVTDILDPAPRDIRDLICVAEAAGDLTLKRKLEERLEEIPASKERLDRWHQLDGR